jgi:hypothetical protein
VALGIAATDGARGDALAVLARDVFRRLAAALLEKRRARMTTRRTFSKKNAFERRDSDDDLAPLLAMTDGIIAGDALAVCPQSDTRGVCSVSSAYSDHSGYGVGRTRRRRLSPQSSNAPSLFSVPPPFLRWCFLGVCLLGAVAFLVPLLVLPALDGRGFWDKQYLERRESGLPPT